MENPALSGMHRVLKAAIDILSLSRYHRSEPKIDPAFIEILDSCDFQLKEEKKIKEMGIRFTGFNYIKEKVISGLK